MIKLGELYKLKSIHEVFEGKQFCVPVKIFNPRVFVDSLYHNELVQFYSLKEKTIKLWQLSSFIRFYEEFKDCE